ncbi:MAG TPA: ABC transporter substrate-binding protein [Candidatus Saccharimonadales bacterium]|jgi:ABC-type transport system substrate-binding protein|nr:ABC transporter substrate-binding protein [Candidatus Saccharimonadales bacterium]
MKDIFRVGFVDRWARSDPRTGLNYASFLVQWHVYESPYRLLPESNQIAPGLLDCPLQNEDGEQALLYSAGVRRNARFSDGTVLTAEHVAASLEKTAAFNLHASASAGGDRVFFRLKRPNFRFDLLLARFDHGIVLERNGEFLGTGPYMLGPGPQAKCFRLVRNPYYEPAAQLEEIECRSYPMDAHGRRTQLLEAVNRGEVDYTDELARDELNRVEKMRKCIQLGYCTAVLFFNTERPIFRESRVRQAFTSAIDRKALAALAYANALAFAATGMIPPVLGSTPDRTTYDLTGALELLEKENINTSTPLVLAVIHRPRPYLPDPRATAELLAAQLSKLGFKIEIRQPRDVQEYQEWNSRGAYDMMLAGWIPDTPDPLDFMESLLGTASIPAPANQTTRSSNLCRWSNAEMDTILEKQRLNPDTATWQRICDMVRNEAPAFPLMYGPRIAVVSWRAKNFPRDFGTGPFLSSVELRESNTVGTDTAQVSPVK